MSVTGTRPTADTQFLNFFRALAALWVVIGHCFQWGGTSLFPLPTPGMAVDLFMVISGFLMLFTVDRARKGGGWVRDFYLRRFFRIAPAYYVALIAVFILQGPYRDGMAFFQAANPDKWGARYLISNFPPIDPANLAMHVSFLFGLLPQYADSTMLPDWSLGLEMQFYAVFPALYFAARYRRFLPISLGLCVACIGGRMIYFRAAEAGWVEPFREPSLLLFCLPMFVTGMLIHEARDKSWSWAAVGIAVLALLELRAHGLSGMPVIGLVTLLAACWLYRIDLLKRWCESRVVSFASNCSYSVYLIHGFVLFLIGPLVSFSPLLMTLVVVTLSYLLSWLSFLYVETPGIALGKVFATRKFSAPPMV
jgi:peptidoglycan/LPS O-acetylase OafA/YrhL